MQNTEQVFDEKNTLYFILYINIQQISTIVNGYLFLNVQENLL
jgi:uncharacterized protein YlbG (UPF0298 family)